MGNIQTVLLPQFRGGRALWVYLPPGYGQTPRRYPTLYMLDGAQVFGPGETLHADHTTTQEINAGNVEPLIIVAIESAKDTMRTFEYTPWPEQFGSANLGRGGGAGPYLEAIRDTIIPLVDSLFLTMPDRRFIAGFSFGGLFAVYASYVPESPFTRVGTLSATYAWGDGRILAFADSAGRGNLERFYQDTGTARDNSVGVLRAMATIAHRQGFVDDVDFLSVEATDQTHSINCWAGRFPEMLRFLLRTQPVIATRAKQVAH